MSVKKDQQDQGVEATSNLNAADVSNEPNPQGFNFNEEDRNNDGYHRSGTEKEIPLEPIVLTDDQLRVIGYGAAAANQSVAGALIQVVTAKVNRRGIALQLNCIHNIPNDVISMGLMSDTDLAMKYVSDRLLQIHKYSKDVYLRKVAENILIVLNDYAKHVEHFVEEYKGIIESIYPNINHPQGLSPQQRFQPWANPLIVGG